MNKINLTKIIKGTRQAISKHSPGILTGIGIAGGITTTVLAVKATPKALKLLDDKKREEHVDKLKPIDVVKTCWKPYVPAAVTGVTSVACLIGASSVNARRNAALATAYKLSETALSEYREKVVETIGEKKEQIIREKVDKARVERLPASKGDIIITGRGTSRCLDVISGRHFESDIDLIQKAENELNRRLLRDDYVSLNEFYDDIGLPHIYPLGEDLGWNVDQGRIEINFSAQLEDDGKPTIVVSYSVGPKYNYSSYM